MKEIPEAGNKYSYMPEKTVLFCRYCGKELRPEEWSFCAACQRNTRPLKAVAAAKRDYRFLFAVPAVAITLSLFVLYWIIFLGIGGMGGGRL